jgi:hypothetical protein
MRELIRLTYISANEPVFVDPEEVVAIEPGTGLSDPPVGCVITLQSGAQISVEETAEQCYARLKQGNTPAKQDTRPATRRPKLSRRSIRNGGQQK